MSKIKINDDFWKHYTQLVKNEVIPYQYKALCDEIPDAPKSGCIENFVKASKVAAAIKRGESVPTYPVDKWEYTDENSDKNSFKGWVFQDSDLYKWIEALGYSLTNSYDEKLKATADKCIDLICSSQLENGYLDTLYIINDRSKIFTDLKDKHELYCFGHMAQAAISYFNATGERKFLDAVCRFADLICDTFGENAKKGYPGHEIAESALVELYKTTGREKYLQTAKFFIDERGKKPYFYDSQRGFERNDNSEDYHYNQAHKSPIMQDEAVGHAVRGVYLYTAMAQLSREYGDDELLSACGKIWDNIENKKLYITGGIGAAVDGEAFSFDYDLPNDLAYCETCASIGLIFFAEKMLEITPDSKYANVLERALYNTVLASVSKDGKAFFYTNPLEVLPEACKKDSRKKHIKTTRQKWFGCACCPPNLARLISSLGKYYVTENDENIFVHLYIGSNIKTDKADIIILSDYNESGEVRFDIKCKKSFTLALRIPDTCSDFSITENYFEKNGYAYIKIDRDTKTEVKFNFPIRLIKCSNLVRENTGKVAVTRGATVYCIEEVDNGKNLQLIRLGENPNFTYIKPYIYADAIRERPDEKLYGEYRTPETEKCKIKLIPYRDWGNRGENEMTVYIRI